MKKPGKAPERGTALLEFAIGFFMLWFLFIGVYQFGYAFYVYNTLLASVTNAAELGAKLGYDTSNSAAFTTAIKNMVVYGDETAGTKSLVPNLTTGNVTVDLHLDGGTPPMPTNVEVAITGYSINALFSTYPLANKPRVITHYYGQVSGS